ncbi:hypothetical protein QR721_05420 [Aciduricibacillus chroicocephali]|uniref:Uncharacterized protein n=1 Tax=Aciduricibacillus chroicocephali TaxID=3054939 RepID=A0ABY9KY09_9BACI|nr:hypothetical protein QR721_05420 [Bacillaceae bacterium 44XB]
MKKRLLLSIATLAGAGIVYQKKRARSNHFDKIARTKLEKGDDLHLEETIEDAGIPDQTGEKSHAQLENAKMVSEGSQFGVQYYNELKEKEYKLKSKGKSAK